MEPPIPTRVESSAGKVAPEGPPLWVRQMIAILLRLGLGISLLNGGLLGYVMARRGSQAGGLGWTTLLGPAAVAGVLEHDLLVPFIQIAIGLALILGFFTVATTIMSGLLILSGPIFQFLAILSNTGPSTNTGMLMQALVTTGSINLLLLVVAVLWMTPVEGTPWSLDALIFAHRRQGRQGVRGATPGPPEAAEGPVGEAPTELAPEPLPSPSPSPSPSAPPTSSPSRATIIASREE